MSISELPPESAPFRSSGLIDYIHGSFAGEPAIIRRFHPPEFWDPLRRIAAIADFVRSMQLQQTLSQQSNRWQAVHAIEAPAVDQAWSVAADSPRSLHDLILLQLTPEPADMVRLVREMLQALRDALQISERSHGRLSADKILLSAPRCSDCQVMLCEPAAGMAAADTVRMDLQALGRIICELVYGRFWSPTVPLEPTGSAFKKCGSNWRQWVAFTRDLLESEHTTDSIDSFLSRVDSLKPRRSRAPLAAGMAAVLLMVAVAGFLYLRHREEMARLARFNGAWHVYVKNYSSWFNFFTKDQALLNSNPAFAAIRIELAKRPVLSPDNILHEFTALLSREKIQHDLAAHPDASRRFGIAVVLLMRSEHALARVHQQLVAARLQWQRRGWNQPAAELKVDLLARLIPDTALQPFLKLHSAPWSKTGDIRRFSARSADAAQVQLRNLLGACRVEAHIKSLDHSLALLAKNPHHLVSRFPAYARNNLQRCKSIHNLGQSVLLLSRQGRIAIESLRRYASRLQWKLIDARPPVTADTPPNRYFPDWFDYCSIPPNENAYLLKRAGIKARINSVRVNISRAQRLPRPPTVNYTLLLNRITDPLNQVRNPQYWIEKNKAKINSLVTSATVKLDHLHSAIVAFIDSQINLKKWTAQFIGYDGARRHYPVNPHALQPFSLSALNTLYLKRVQFIILGSKAAGARPWAADAETYNTLLTSLRTRRWQVPQINTRVAALKASLRRLNHHIFKISAATPASSLGRADFNRLLAATLIPARLAAIEVAARLGSFGPRETFVPPQRVLARWQKQQSAFNQLVHDLGALSAELDIATLPGASAKNRLSPVALYARLAGNLWWPNPTVASVTASLRRAMAAAKALSSAGAEQLPSLVAKISVTAARWRPFLLRTAWHQTGRFSLQQTPGLLALEQHIAPRLIALARSLALQKSHPGRASRLILTLRRRWEQRLNQAGPAAMVVSVTTASPRYGVKMSNIRTLADLASFHQVSAAGRFNLLVFALDRQAMGIKSPDRAKQIAQRFASLLVSAGKHKFYRAWQSYPAYARLTAELTAVLKANPAKASEPSGPALAGWHEEKVSPTQRVFVAPGGRQHMQFTLVHPAKGRACFICDQELRVGIFLHTIHSSHNILRRPASAFFNLIRYNSDYLGPHTWVYSRRTDDIAVAPTWFTNTNQIYAAPRFPASIATSAGKLRASSGGNPTRRSPVQYLPPRAAVFVAALLGCRLPTVADWQAAYQLSRQPSAGAQLPGKALAAYVAYLNREDSSLDARLPTPQFWDIFGNSAPALHAFRNQYGTGGTNRIFFRPVTSGGTSPGFANLVGNVAEYVFDGRGAYAAQLKKWYKTPATLTAGSVKSLLTVTALKRFYVIGGSALTPLGTVPPDKPATIDWATRRAQRGFSDVGLRLAYNRRVLTPQQLLARLIRRDLFTRAG